MAAKATSSIQVITRASRLLDAIAAYDDSVSLKTLSDITRLHPSTAFRIGEKTDDPLEMYLTDVFTISLNVAGICGISVPCGFDNQGLPIGLQLVGPHLGEETVLRAAYAYEQSTTWHQQRAELK